MRLVSLVLASIIAGVILVHILGYLAIYFLFYAFLGRQ